MDVFNNIDTTVGTSVAIPTGIEGRAYVVTQSPNFYAAWHKFSERIKGDRNVKFYVDHFHDFTTDTMFEDPTAKEVIQYMKKRPTNKFYLSVNYRTKIDSSDDEVEGERATFEIPNY